MARPKPQILLEHVDSVTYRAEQILKADAVYAVCYDGEPINLRSVNKLVNYPPKYKKVNFSNVGHAKHLAERLNSLFRTDKFSVKQFSIGDGIDIPLGNDEE